MRNIERIAQALEDMVVEEEDGFVLVPGDHRTLPIMTKNKILSNRCERHKRLLGIVPAGYWILRALTYMPTWPDINAGIKVLRDRGYRFHLRSAKDVRLEVTGSDRVHNPRALPRHP